VPSRHYALRPPTGYRVDYEINPWMDRAVQPNSARANAEWTALVAALRQLGAAVDIVDGAPSLPDAVFLTDCGFVANRTYIPASFRFGARSRETVGTLTWMESRGFHVLRPPHKPGVYLEGGDIRVFGDRLVGGYGWRSSMAGLSMLCELTGLDLLPVRLTDARYFHLDMTFCALDDRSALMIPAAWDSRSRRALFSDVHNPIVLTEDEALAFSAIAIVIGTNVVMHSCSERLRRLLETNGFHPVVTPAGEFIKAGGGVSCMAMPLDSILRFRRRLQHRPRAAARERATRPPRLSLPLTLQ